jgi:aminopeptidase S
VSVVVVERSRVLLDEERGRVTSDRRLPRASVTACALGLAVALAGCGTAVPGSADNSAQGGTAPAVSGAGATQHLQALQRIADENGGNRASPSPGYEASVDYVAKVLRGAGYQVSTPTFPISTGRGSGEV